MEHKQKEEELITEQKMGSDGLLESEGTATRPLAFCSFLWRVTAGSLNPNESTRLFQHIRHPLLTARGRKAGWEKSMATPAKRSGLDYQLIFFSNI